MSQDIEQLLKSKSRGAGKQGRGASQASAEYLSFVILKVYVNPWLVMAFASYVAMVGLKVCIGCTISVEIQFLSNTSEETCVVLTMAYSYVSCCHAH